MIKGKEKVKKNFNIIIIVIINNIYAPKIIAHNLIDPRKNVISHDCVINLCSRKAYLMLGFKKFLLFPSLLIDVMA